MHNTTVSDLMRRQPINCSPLTTLKEAAELMAEEECGLLPVVEADRVVGVITDRDVALALARWDRRASMVRAQEAMSRPAITCRSGEPVESALERMRERGVRRLVVVTAEGSLEGVLSLDDAALAARSLDQRAWGAPLYPDVARTLQGICVVQAAPVRVAH